MLFNQVNPLFYAILIKAIKYNEMGSIIAISVFYMIFELEHRPIFKDLKPHLYSKRKQASTEDHIMMTILTSIP